MKKIILFLTVLTLFLAACTGGNTTTSVGVNTSAPTADTTTTDVEETNASENTVTTPVVAYKPEDLSPATTVDTVIHLNGNTITVDGLGVGVNGSIATITAAGTYEISGTLNDGQILVDVASTDLVTLVLAGADITSSTSAPIFITNADKVVITLAEGSQNTLTDGPTYISLDESGEPNAALFSKDDLTINGTGALTVNANFNNGIGSKDDLKITGGTITVNAVNDGIKGKDSVAILDGAIIVTAGADGVQSTNAVDVDRGYVAVEGGALNIIAGLDGVQAETNLLISGGTLNIVTGGGSVASAAASFGGGRGMQEGNPNQTADSVKGLKAGGDLTITNGDITISALDDALNANNNVVINGGALEIASGDDAVHADITLTINGGTLNITQSYEGLESQIITLNDGTIHLISSDDGINAADGGDGSGAETGDNYVYINGGYLFMDAGGDGLDSNGNFAMTGGVVLVNGPTNNGNGPLDYGMSFKVTGGFLVAVGSAGMAQAPSTDSTQYGLLQVFDTVQSAGTLIHIETAAGENVLTFLPTKEYQSIVLSSPDLQNGESYVVYTGGSASGTSVDGLYTDGTYTPGTQAANFTITSIVTGQGMSSFGGPGGRPPGGGNPPSRP